MLRDATNTRRDYVNRVFQTYQAKYGIVEEIVNIEFVPYPDFVSSIQIMNDLSEEFHD